MMKLFGKNLFSFKKKIDPSEMYDFAQHGLLGGGPIIIEDFISFTSGAVSSNSGSSTGGNITTVTKPKEKGKKKKKITPKELFTMGSLNDNDFAINIDKEYLASNIKDLEDKLLLYPSKEKDIRVDGAKYGRKELISIVGRLKNRERIGEFKSILDEYPHTTSELVNKVVGTHSNLRCKLATEFIPDFPRDAVNAMKKYNNMCVELSNKTTHFYVVADKKDFQIKDRKRDPILLAQSPFGFFWQILGAWDEEMIYLGDL